jgi:NAD(P)-dependent dehydrogenase (short-subunit alcohol dehydrogenase family)
MVDAARGHLGRIDILVNNAGIQRPQAITETSLGDWERMMASTCGERLLSGGGAPDAGRGPRRPRIAGAPRSTAPPA